MKRILVPTDFSGNAITALDYSIDMANHFGSKILLVHSYWVPSKAGSFISLERIMLNDINRQMAAMVKRVEKRLKNGASVDRKILRGTTIASIVDMAKQGPADIIMMGTQGASGLKGIFLGSTTNGVIQNTKTPVLAIPAEFQFRPIESIVLAIDDLEIISSQTFQPLVQMARHCKARIMVYHLDRGDKDPGIDPSISMFLDGVEHSFHYELKKDSVNESINRFVAEQNADMLCMVRRERGFLERTLHKSATQKEVLNSIVPLLILHDPKP